MQCSRNRSSCKVCSLNAILHQTIYRNVLYICILCIFWTHIYQYASTSCFGIKSVRNIPHFWLITRTWSFFVLRPSFNPFPSLFWGQKVASVYSFWQFTLSGDRRVLHNGFGIQLFPEVGTGMMLAQRTIATKVSHGQASPLNVGELLDPWQALASSVQRFLFPVACGSVS